MFYFAESHRPLIVELITTRGGKLSIMSEIASYGPTACRDFAMLLLRDDHTVRRLRRTAQKDDDMFIHDVFDDWLKRDDEDSAVPRTWEKLCSCIKDTPGLPGKLAREIRTHFCS